MIKILFAAILSLWVSVAHAQNPTCPTRLPGDNSNACASTAFAQRASQVFNVLAYGADNTGVKDSTTAFTTAFTAASASGGGTVYAPAGSYSVTSLGTISSTNIILQCADRNATQIMQTTTSGDLLTFSSAPFSGVRNCTFRPTARSTFGFQVKFNNCYGCELTNVSTQYAYNGFSVLDSTEVTFNNVECNSILGIHCLYYGGSAGSYGLTLNHLLSSNPYLNGVPSYKAWATSTAYTAGMVTYVNNSIYQAVNSGTSANSGSGPSGLPSGTTAVSAFYNNITDGTVQWRFVSGSLSHIYNDSFGYSLRGNNVVLIYGLYGMVVADTTPTGSSYPAFLAFNDLETDHTLSDGVVFYAGQDAKIANSFLGSSLIGNGLTTTSTFKGALKLIGNQIAGNAATGVAVGGGTNNIILGNEISSNGISSPGTYSGIYVLPNVSKFNIASNTIGTNPGIGTNWQAFGVYIDVGASDYYNVTNNTCGGSNTIACVIDNGTGTHKTLSGNN